MGHVWDVIYVRKLTKDRIRKLAEDAGVSISWAAHLLVEHYGEELLKDLPPKPKVEIDYLCIRPETRKRLGELSKASGIPQSEVLSILSSRYYNDLVSSVKKGLVKSKPEREKRGALKRLIRAYYEKYVQQADGP